MDITHPEKDFERTAIVDALAEGELIGEARGIEKGKAEFSIFSTLL